MRNESLNLESRDMYNRHTFEYDVRIAGSSKHMLTPLLVDYPLELNSEFCLRGDNLTGATFLMHCAKSQQINKQIAEYVLSKSPKEIWLSVHKKGGSVLTGITGNQFNECIARMFISHLMNSNDTNLINKAWHHTNVKGWTPFDYVLRYRDFCGSEQWIMDLIPEWLRRDDQFMYGHLDSSLSSSIYLAVLNQSNNNNNGSVIDRLRLLKKEMKDEWYDECLGICDKKNKETPLMRAVSSHRICDELLQLLTPQQRNTSSVSSDYWTRCDKSSRNLFHIVLMSKYESSTLCEELKCLVSHITSFDLSLTAVAEMVTQKNSQKMTPVECAQYYIKDMRWQEQALLILGSMAFSV